MYYTYQATALLPGNLPFLIRNGIRDTTGSYSPESVSYFHQGRFVCLVVDFWGFRSSSPGMAYIREELSEQDFDYSFFYLQGLEDQFSATEDAVVHLDTLYLLDHRNMIASISELSS